MSCELFAGTFVKAQQILQLKLKPEWKEVLQRSSLDEYELKLSAQQIENFQTVPIIILWHLDKVISA